MDDQIMREVLSERVKLRFRCKMREQGGVKKKKENTRTDGGTVDKTDLIHYLQYLQ